MKVLIPIVCALVAGLLVFIIMQKRAGSIHDNIKTIELKNAVQSVQKQLNELSQQISERLGAFAESIASDKDFSIRLLVENDRSAPVVAESAVRFRGAMGFTLLEIIDSAGIILSSGHFPASAGNSAGEKVNFLTDKPVMLEDNVMGMQVLTLQAKRTLKIADIPFYVMGGMTVDEELLKELTPRDGVTVLLKRGDDVIGMQNVKSISDVKNGKILINDKEYSAATIPLTYTGGGDVPQLIVVVEK